MVFQGRWSLVTGSVILKCWAFWQNYPVHEHDQGRVQSLMAVVTQDKFHYYFEYCNKTMQLPIINISKPTDSELTGTWYMRYGFGNHDSTCIFRMCVNHTVVPLF